MEKSETESNSYLSFKLGDEEFASHVNSVLNILEMTKITKVPKAPDYMKGVINLRGTVLPVVDTRLKFGLTETVFTDKTCIIVMDIIIDDQKVLIGSLVDAVISVIEVDNNEIQPPPNIGSKYRSEFITGMVKIDEKFIMLLDMVKVFTFDELHELKDKTVEVKEDF
ncbi:MAG: chemotaxis protein CheW [Bacteroidales bacterium]|nr:chemotaxis protein CheW [Bacteroidales bacterium]